MSIRPLSDQTIGKIAAGEVIERPASIVKELIENAIDAGASRIDIEIAEGGLELIRVSDTGSGIAAADLPLAVQRHATSKLTDFADLNHIRSLGFRGEALASVAAVARVEIVSSHGQRDGAVLTAEFGQVGDVRPAAATQGTSVTVRHLFENVPARRKFLKQTSTESTVIGRVASAYTAAFPEIEFSLESDGRRLFATDGSGDLTATATALFGAEVGGAALGLRPLDESARVDGVEVSGWVTGPSVTRSHRQQMHVFVNGRLIQHRSLNFMIEECFHTLLMVGRHPITMVRFEIEPERVDVNVHPTKAEVRFLDERSVARAAQRAVHAALAGAPHDDLPRITFTGQRAGEPPFQPVLLPSPVQTRNGQAALDDPDASVEIPQRRVPMLRVLGQVSATYIIAEGPDGLYLIDQHAAHERVMYEQIRGQMSAGQSEQQPYLDPLIVELDQHETAVMDRSLPELRQIGFDIETFGEQSYVIRAIPAIMANVDIRERIHLILRELGEGGVGDSWLDSVAISAACHTSIRAGQLMSIAEMRELVAQLERTEHPRACGHGRPTMLLMSQVDLEKQFSRR
jgi:DNA mismatch repair protein MutL